MVLNDGVSNTPISKTAQSAGQLQLPGPELQVCTKVDLVRDLRAHRLFRVVLGLPGRLVPHPSTQGHVCGEMAVAPAGARPGARPQGLRRCRSQALALLAARTLSEAALARSVGLDIGSFTIPSTSADSAPDGPPVAALAALAVVGARLGWRRRGVAGSGCVSRVREAI